MTVEVQGFRLSPQQRRAWRLGEGSAPVRVGCALWLEGPLSSPRLRAALTEVVRRHEALRTTFQRAPGLKMPVQVVGDAAEVAWSEHAFPEAEADEAVRAYLDGELAAPAAPEGEPVLRASLLRVGLQQHVLTLTAPLLNTDAAGLGAVVAELARLYAGDGGSLPPADELVQYVQFSEWQQQFAESEESQEGRAFWAARDARPEPLELETEARSAEGAPYAPGRRPLTLSPEVAAGLRRAADRLEASLDAVLLAAWLTVLGRLARRSDPAVEVALAGRSYDELAGVVGPFRKTATAVGRLSWGAPFAESAVRLGAALDELSALQDSCPVAEEARRSDVGFETVEWPLALSAGEVRLSLIDLATGTDPRRLTLVAVHPSAPEAAAGRPGLRAELVYDASAFSAREAARLAAKVESVLAAVAADPDARLGELDLLGPAEREELLVRFNATEADYPRGATLHQLFVAQAERTPALPALHRSGEELSYEELAGHARGLAARLRAAGVGPGSRVGVCLERDFDLVAVLLAVLEAGAAYVPIDPAHPRDRRLFVMNDAEVCLTVTRHSLHGDFAEAGRPVVAVEELLAGGAADAAAAFDSAAASAPAGSDALAYVLYTSGSTGRPKGVMVPHRGVVNYLTWACRAYRLEEGGKAPVQSPVGFDLTVTSLFGPLVSGGCAVLVPEEDGVEGLGLAMERHRDLALVKLTPSFLEVLNQAFAGGGFRGRTRALILGGEALASHVVAPWIEQSPETRLINEFGPTETVVGCAVYEVDPAEETPASVPIGRPIANSRLYVLGEGLRPLPTGMSGHLHVAGDGLAHGYLGRPALTAERFIPDPFASLERAGSRLYRTGDLARFRADGELDFRGRLDQQVKIRGYRIEPGEVENALLDHPAIQAAAVIAVGEESAGRQLAAYVVGETGTAGEAGAADLRAFLAERLPEYMIPGAFVSLPALPLTANGKVDRAALPALDAQRADARAPYAAPRTPMEETLAAVWPQVLGLETVGIDDNFFALGGDSIRSVRAVALAKERGVESSVEQLLELQTIRELAADLESAGGSGVSTVRSRPFEMVRPEDRQRLPADAEDAYPLTSLQAGMLYHMGLDHEYPLYHNVNTWHLRVPFDRERFLEAVGGVVSRHPALRTSFDFLSYGEPLQIVHRTAEPELGFEDLRHLDAAEQSRFLEAFWDDERRRVFTLEDYPYFRLFFHRRTDDTLQLTLVESHAILDGWSTTSTLAEIFEDYLSLLAGKPAPNDRPLATTFADYVQLERRAMESEESREYWTRLLERVEPTPLARWPERSGGGPQQQKIYTDVPREDLEALRGVARRLAVPLRSVLLAVHLKMLAWATGHRQVVSGLVFNGRPEQTDGERVRGLFLNTLPFPFDLPDGSWLDLVREVFEAERGMLAHRRYPMALVQRGRGRERLYEAGFTYLHFHSVEKVLGDSDVELLDDDEKDFSFNSFLLNVTFFVSPTLDQLRIILEYDGSEIHPEQAQAVSDVLVRIIDRLTRSPEASHVADDLLSREERRRVAELWEAPPSGESLGDLFPAETAALPPQLRARVLDAHGHAIPVGARGELYLAGLAPAEGGGDRPEGAAEGFVPNPGGGEPALLYRTGRWARLGPDGELEVLGRVGEAAARTAPSRASRGDAPASPPRTEIERQLAEVWRQVLAVDEVGIHDSFFDLGGNSLLLYELSLKLQALWPERGLRVMDLMRHPTIASLSESFDAPEASRGAAEADDRAAKLERGRKQPTRVRRAPR